MGIWHFKLQALLVIAASIVSAMLAEFVFDYIAHRKNTLTDGSAIVTGLLLALCLPASVPLYIPCLGAAFAIIVAKNLFGGLGHNFMNPALAGRCFLLISFSGIVANYAVDGYSSATPLAQMASGQAVNVTQMLIGNTSGVIGNSTIALFIGGMILWAMGGITFEIPAAIIVSFTAFVALFGGQGFNPDFPAGTSGRRRRDHGSIFHGNRSGDQPGNFYRTVTLRNPCWNPVWCVPYLRKLRRLCKLCCCYW